jgi:hypothetical protein
VSVVLAEEGVCSLKNEIVDIGWHSRGWEGRGVREKSLTAHLVQL